MPPACARWLVLAIGALVASGCLGVFSDDGSSVAVGAPNRGVLLRGVALPPVGAGYEVPRAWRPRGRQFATEEVVRWLTSSFSSVNTAFPDSLAAIGDLSAAGGGRSGEHRSHETGRDIDIFFYAVDWEGRPYRLPEAMPRFGPDGLAVSWSRADRGWRDPTPIPLVRFDTRRTWALVRSLMTDGGVDVQYIFIQRNLAQMLIEAARRDGEDPALLARAAALLRQPAGVDPHDDHMHVRVACSAGDRTLGCLDQSFPRLKPQPKRRRPAKSLRRRDG